LDTKRQKIVAALKAQLETILVVAGYYSDLGKHVTEWDTTPMDPNAQVMQLDYRDEEEDRQDSIGCQIMTMPFVIRIRVSGETSLNEMRLLIADVTRKIYSDIQLAENNDPPLAQYIKQDGPAKIIKNEAGDIATGATLRYMITYTVDRGLS
jgi:hypothetical protein